MSDHTDVLAGMLALLMCVAIYLVYFGILLAFIWAIWNWIVLPTLPYVAGLFA